MFPIYFLTLLVTTLLSLNNTWLVWRGLRDKKKSHPRPKLSKEAFPSVAIQLPIFNEAYAIDDLLDCVAKISYPREKLTIQVLDDSTDDTPEKVEKKLQLLRLAQPDLLIQHIRRTERKEFKAGALKEGFEKTQAEYFAIFDADFRPSPNFLEVLVPHFNDPRVAVVQGTWLSFSNFLYSWVTKVGAYFITYDHHMNIGKDGQNYWFNFKGTGGMLRREAITNAGHWQGDTLTEDMDLSFRMCALGYKMVYLRDYPVTNEIPPRLTDFLDQQSRWAVGSIFAGFKLFPLIIRSKTTWIQKLQAFNRCFGALFCCLMAPLLTIFGYHFLTSGVNSFWVVGSLTLICSSLMSHLVIRLVLPLIEKDGSPRLTDMLCFFSMISLCVYCWQVFLMRVFTGKKVWNRTPKSGAGYDLSRRTKKHLPDLLEFGLLAGIAYPVCQHFLHFKFDALWIFFATAMATTLSLGVSSYVIRWMERRPRHLKKQVGSNANSFSLGSGIHP